MAGDAFMSEQNENSGRGRAPVFVVGCPRSGTTLLYHMLLSAGGFAIYRAESQVFNLLLPRFGDLRIRKNRERLMDEWLQTTMFAVSGLDAARIKAKILDECGNYGDFLRIYMEDIAAQQTVDRWADCTPEHLLFLREIRASLPDALIIHAIRDGRDVALSMEKQGWIRPFTWDRKRSLLAPALYWRWIVMKGREDSQIMGSNYLEVHYEDLVAEPRQALGRIGRFIDHDLDYDRILRTGIGSVSHPNTSFGHGQEKTEFSPVERWRKLLTTGELSALESIMGDLLADLGYPLSNPSVCVGTNGMNIKLNRAIYGVRFDIKHWAKTRTRLNGFWRRTVPILAASPTASRATMEGKVRRSSEVTEPRSTRSES